MKNYSKETLLYPSSCPDRTITYTIYKTLSPPRAILQLSHGMCEYVERYEPLAHYLTSRGILLCGNDHLGHGRTGDKYNEFGYFAEENGDKFVTRDVKNLTKIMKKQYPDIPYILMGHSMGSFIARDYLSTFAPHISGCILSGTSGKNFLASLGITTTTKVGSLKGGKYRSNLIKQLGIGSYNKGYGAIGKEHWISRDPKVIETYRADPFCNFEFTMLGYRDMVTLLKRVNEPQWFTSVPEDFPLLFISGTGDPVGRYGKGVNEVVENLEQTNHSNVTNLLYPNARHELCNELNKKDVYRDLYNWIAMNFLYPSDQQDVSQTETTMDLTEEILPKTPVTP